MATKRNITYKCPFCNARFNREDLVIHIEDNHEDDLPKDFTPFRYVFNYVNKKPLVYHGKCTECGGPTKWDENKGRYNRQCDKKSCHDSYVKKFENNMVKVTGTTRISSTAEGQCKMLANRKISGTYTFRNGVKKTYTGSYERKALEFMDLIMKLDPNDIMCPGPILDYTWNGKKFMYISDFYYQPYNLIIEVKDGGDNPNKRNMPEYRAKQIAKEENIIRNTNYNYLRLTNNNMAQLLSAFVDLKYQMIENTGERVIHVNESSELLEWMSPASYGKVCGLRDSDAYIVSYQQNNVYAEPKLGLSTSIFDKVIGIDDDNIMKKIDEFTIVSDKALDVGSIEEVSKILAPYMNTKVDSKNFIYEKLSGNKVYTTDQVYYSNFGKVVDASNTFNESMNKLLDQYINKEAYEDIEKIEELVNEVGRYGQI